MIEQLRRGAQSGLSYILIGVLIVFFAVFFGVPADGCQAGDGSRARMASVNGDHIYTEDVNAILNRYFGGQRRSSQPDDEFFNQQAEALEIVIATYLLSQKAEAAGLRVSDDEFTEFITDPFRNIEFLVSYGRTGQFDGPFYERYVQFGLNVPINRYEDFKRRELLARKYLVLLDMQAHTTSQEIDELHELRNTRVDLEFLSFDEDTLANALSIDDETIENFLADGDNMSRVDQYFADNRDQYAEEEEVQLRTIRLFKADDEDDAQQAFEEALERVNDGEDFGDVARELSEDFYRDEGGLMDWTTLDNIDQSIADAISDADVGDVRDVETDHAFIIVRVEDRQEETVADIEEVQNEIAEHLLRQDIIGERGGELAAELLEKLREGLTIDEALDALEEEALDDEREDDAATWASLSSDTTGFFNLEGESAPEGFAQFDMGDFGRDWDDIPGIGQYRELAIEAFQLSEGSPLIDRVVELDDAVAVIRLHDREEPGELSSSERLELRLEARSAKVSELLGPWQNFFQQPSLQQVHYIADLYSDAMDAGDIRLYDRNSRAAALVRQRVQDDLGIMDDTADMEQTIDLDDLEFEEGDLEEEDFEE